MPTSNLSGYAVGGAGGTPSASSGTSEENKGETLSLSSLKRDYLDYLGSKREEINEQQDARRFRHGSHWTSDQITQLKARKQPIVWENIVGRKVHGIVGTLVRLKQDPKAYPRTPKHEDGAELASASLRYALDAENWDSKDPICAEFAAVDGIGGVEFNIVEGDRGDREIEIEVVNPDSFFYDPRSYQHDFSDARYMGVGKWLSLDQAIEMFPDKEEELRSTGSENGSELSSEADREWKWYQTYENEQRVRVVEHWYKRKGKWNWCIYTGDMKLMEGESYLVDEKGQTTHKYEMFSAYIDQDGDRYGITRDLKPLNLEVNMRKSKALHTMLSRRLIAEQGAFDDIEKARREAARPDGVVIRNKGFDAQFDDTARIAETEAQFKFYEQARTALESFGPNVAITGEGLENSSGRAIHLLQQAGLADLGPFIQAYRGWKIRVYRKMWNAIQRHWTGERWVRVTDDDDISEFIQINGFMDPNTGMPHVDPNTGQPTIVNALGSLDVDIILDEGPDAVNQMGDTYDTLSIMARQGTGIPPAVLIEMSPLPLSTKKKLLDMLNPPEPTPQQELEMRGAQAEVAETEASAGLKQAQAIKALSDANQPPQMPEQQDPRIVEMDALEKMGKAEASFASAEHKRAQTFKTFQDAMSAMQNRALEPERLNMERERMGA